VSCKAIAEIGKISKIADIGKQNLEPQRERRNTQEKPDRETKFHHHADRKLMQRRAAGLSIRFPMPTIRSFYVPFWEMLRGVKLTDNLEQTAQIKLY
jgi:hypothetical protein